MDDPDTHPVLPPDRGAVIAIPAVDKLHHQQERMAA
jgi:hypothetical protein